LIPLSKLSWHIGHISFYEPSPSWLILRPPENYSNDFEMAQISTLYSTKPKKSENTFAKAASKPLPMNKLSIKQKLSPRENMIAEKWTVLAAFYKRFSVYSLS